MLDSQGLGGIELGQADTIRSSKAKSASEMLDPMNNGPLPSCIFAACKERQDFEIV